MNSRERARLVLLDLALSGSLGLLWWTIARLVVARGLPFLGVRLPLVTADAFAVGAASCALFCLLLCQGAAEQVRR